MPPNNPKTLTNSSSSSAADYPNDSSLTVSSSVSNTTFSNQLCINFTDPGESPSETIKCRSFWHWVHSTTGLEAVMAVGRSEEGRDSATSPPPSALPDDYRPWLHQLLKLKTIGLHEVALEGVRTHPREVGAGVLTNAIEQNGAQVMEDIAEFEASLARREAERDPNQTILGYRAKQPPPRIAN